MGPYGDDSDRFDTENELEDGFSFVTDDADGFDSDAVSTCKINALPCQVTCMPCACIHYPAGMLSEPFMKSDVFRDPRNFP